MIRLATLLVWILALLPTGFGFAFLLGGNWPSAHGALAALGRLAGVGGLGFLLVAASLSSRVPGFDRAFGGLTKLWKTHHRLAAVSFLLMLLHPWLLALAAGGQARGAVAVLFPADFPAIWIGWAALLVMMIFLAPSFSFFGEPDYQHWKWLHRLAGVAVILALAHAFPLAQAIPHPWDFIIWLSLTALAVAAVAYRWLFSRHLGGRHSYQVTTVEPVAKDVVEISLQARERPLHYRAGQFIYLTPYDDQLPAGYREEHPYTISSSPHEPQLRVAVKDLGDGSRALQRLRVGSEVQVEGPYGAFFASEYDEDSELWIAGGIGITPFLGRARYLQQNMDEVDVCLIYCVQDESRALFAAELESIARQLPGFQVHFHYFYQQGPLSWPFLEGRCHRIAQRGVYICGPEGLMTLARKLVAGHGVPAKRIHTEEFDLL